MTAEEVVAQFKPQPKRRTEWGAIEPAYVGRPLNRVESLTTYRAMKQFRGFPNVQVAPPLWEWPDWLKEDIDTLMIAEAEAGRETAKWQANDAAMDAAEAKISGGFHGQGQ